MTRDSCGSKLESVLQLTGIYTTLIAVIFVSGIIILECFVVIYRILVSSHLNLVSSHLNLVSSHLNLVSSHLDITLYGCYIVVGVINIICVGVLFYKSLPEIKNLKSGNETALSEVAILFVIALYLSAIYMVDYSVPDFLVWKDDWILRVLALDAPVSEEILFRVLCIGVPVLFIALIIKKRDARPPLWKYLAGGFGINNNLTLSLIFLSSLMFGAAHMESWGMWKFGITFILGLMLGYLFVKYGLYASISIHFLINCLAIEVLLLYRSLYGLHGGGVAGFGVDYLLIFIMMAMCILCMIICIPCTYLYVKKKGECFSKTLLKGKSN